MKKIAPIMIAVIAIIVLGGVFLVFKKDKEKGIETKTPIIQKEAETKVEESNENGNNAGIIEELSKIKEGKKMKCVYTVSTEDGSFQSETYIEGNKYKSVSMMSVDDQAKTYMVFDGKDQYIWVDGEKNGTKMNADCLAENTKQMQDTVKENENLESDVPGVNDLFEDALDVKCEPVDSIDFTVPSEITFNDQCEMLKNQMKQINDLKGALPAGMSVPVEEE